MSDGAFRRYQTTLAGARGVAPWHESFKSRSLATSPGKLHLDVAESGSDAPATVVFLPGTNGYALLYGELLAALQGFNVVGVDPRGHGRSHGLRASYTLAEILEDAQSAVDWAARRFSKPVFLMGSSQGGIAAFYGAATIPALDRV